MDFIDILGGLGSGYNDAVMANQKQARGYNDLQQSNIATARLQDQYNADDDYDIFNAVAANNRSKQDLGEGTNDLALMGIQDKMDAFDPNTRAQIGALAQQFGGDTPEFRKALGNYQASRGRLADADPQYAKFNQEAQARQQVVAQMQSMPAFQGVQIDSVQKDEYGNLIALVGEPDENGDYEVMDLPPSLTRLYAGLTGNTKPLGMDLKQQQGMLAAQAAQRGQFSGTRGVTQRTQAQADINTRAEARNAIQLTKIQQDNIAKFAKMEADKDKELQAFIPDANTRRQAVTATMMSIPGYAEAVKDFKSAIVPVATKTVAGSQSARAQGKGSGQTQRDPQATPQRAPIQEDAPPYTFQEMQ
jgi:hypothetical protein